MNSFQMILSPVKQTNRVPHPRVQRIQIAQYLIIQRQKKPQIPIVAPNEMAPSTPSSGLGSLFRRLWNKIKRFLGLNTESLSGQNIPLTGTDGQMNHLLPTNYSLVPTDHQHGTRNKSRTYSRSRTSHRCVLVIRTRTQMTMTTMTTTTMITLIQSLLAVQRQNRLPTQGQTPCRSVPRLGVSACIISLGSYGILLRSF